jgi:hypothetical protein
MSRFSLNVIPTHSVSDGDNSCLSSTLHYVWRNHTTQSQTDPDSGEPREIEYTPVVVRT